MCDHSDDLFSLLEECGKELELLCMSKDGEVTDNSESMEECDDMHSCRASLNRLETLLSSRSHVLVSHVKSVSQDLEALTQEYALNAHKSEPKMQGTELNNQTSTSTSNVTTTSTAQVKLNSQKAFAIWRHYQDEGFQRHVRRQDQARAMEKRNNELIRRQTLRRLRRTQIPIQAKETPRSSLLKHTENKSKAYLDRFDSQNARISISPDSKIPISVCPYTESSNVPIESRKIHAHSLTDLKAKIQKEFDVSHLSNLYRSRSNTPIAMRHLRRWNQIHDAKYVFFTRTPRQDVAILCHWLTSRQTKNKQQQLARLIASKTDKQTLKETRLVSSTSDIATAHVHNRVFPTSCVMYDYNGRAVSAQKNNIRSN